MGVQRATSREVSCDEGSRRHEAVRVAPRGERRARVLNGRTGHHPKIIYWVCFPGIIPQCRWSSLCVDPKAYVPSTL